MEKNEYVLLGKKKGITGIITDIYEDQEMGRTSVEDDVIANCEKDPQMAVKLIKSLIMCTGEAFIAHFKYCSNNIPVDNW